MGTYYLDPAMYMHMYFSFDLMTAFDEKVRDQGDRDKPIIKFNSLIAKIKYSRSVCKAAGGCCSLPWAQS